MLKKSNLMLTLILSILMLTLIGCSSSNNTSNKSSDNNPTTKDEYNTYLTERYNYYFNDSSLYNNYNIYETGFDYNNSYDEFISSYNNSYVDFKTNLQNLKKDLETNVKKGTSEVDKLNQEIITSIDNSIKATDEYTSNFDTKAKDYASFSKDEVIKGLQNIGKVPYDARMELKKLVNNAKISLGL